MTARPAYVDALALWETLAETASGGIDFRPSPADSDGELEALSAFYRLRLGALRTEALCRDLGACLAVGAAAIREARERGRDPGGPGAGSLSGGASPSAGP